MIRRGPVYHVHPNGARGPHAHRPTGYPHVHVESSPNRGPIVIAIVAFILIAGTAVVLAVVLTTGNDDSSFTPTWTEWMDGHCIRTCGAGMRTRTRICLYEKEEGCEGPSRLTEDCDPDVECPATETPRVPGEWGPWTPIWECAEDCQDTVRDFGLRSRVCYGGSTPCLGSGVQLEDCPALPCR